MTTTSSDLEIRTYIAAVAARLGDLDPEERDDLMADLEQHLREVAAEGEGRLADRLGSPESYAAELRASAGLPPTVHDPAPLRDGVLKRAWNSDAMQRVRAFVREVEPGWWIVRAGIVGMFVVLASASSSSMSTLVFLGVLALPAFSWPSVKLGRVARQNRSARVFDVVASIVAGMMAIAMLGMVADHVSRGDDYNYVIEPQVLEYLHHEDGEPITNLCVYDSKLRPLDGVLVFDPTGKPIDNPLSAPVDVPRFANVYPREVITDPGTGETAEARPCPTLTEPKSEPEAEPAPKEK